MVLTTPICTCMHSEFGVHFSILDPCIMVFSDKLQSRLRSEGGIKALLGMVRCRHPDVLSQVARGIANFAKCESRASTQGNFFTSVKENKKDKLVGL